MGTRDEILWFSLCEAITFKNEISRYGEGKGDAFWT